MWSNFESKESTSVTSTIIGSGSNASTTREENDTLGDGDKERSVEESVRDEDIIPPRHQDDSGGIHVAGDGRHDKSTDNEFAEGGLEDVIIDRKELLEESNENLPRKNLVLDYKSMRKSGYFLEKHLTRNYSNTACLSTTDKASNVTQWLNSVPDNDISQSELTDLDETDLLKNLLGQLFSEEECLKRLILEEESTARAKLNFTSKPTQTLTYRQLDELIEETNEYVDKFLEDARGEMKSQRECEYVCGTVAFPECWRRNSKDEEEMRKGDIFGFNWIKSWFTNVVSNPIGSSTEDQELSPTVDEGQLILEPYRGPTFINGAVLKSGSPGNNQGLRSLPGKIVEEVKALLLTIRMALRKTEVDPAGLSLTKAKTSQEDTEINQLTELLQKALLEKKSALKKTVFVLKNLPKSTAPTTRNVTNSPAAQGGNTRHRTIFSRAISGMIRRPPTSIRQSSYRLFRDNRGFTYVRSNRISPEGPSVMPMSHTSSISGNFITGLRSFVKFITPFKIPSPVPGSPYRDLAASDEDYSVMQQQQPQLRLENISRTHLRPHQTVRHGQKNDNMKRLRKIGRY